MKSVGPFHVSRETCRIFRLWFNGRRKFRINKTSGAHTRAAIRHVVTTTSVGTSSPHPVTWTEKLNVNGCLPNVIVVFPGRKVIYRVFRNCYSVTCCRRDHAKTSYIQISKTKKIPSTSRPVASGLGVLRHWGCPRKSVPIIDYGSFIRGKSRSSSSSSSNVTKPFDSFSTAARYTPPGSPAVGHKRYVRALHTRHTAMVPNIFTSAYHLRVSKFFAYHSTQ